MRGVTARLFVLAGALAVVVAGAAAAPAEQGAYAEADLNGTSWSAPTPQSVPGWSAERFANAEPLSFALPAEAGTPSHEWIEPEGPVRFSPAAAPEGEFLAAASPLEISGSTARAGYDYPGPYTQFRLRYSEAKQFPLRAIGKLFLVAPDGTMGECSAASIGNFAIWTAGHCVHVGGGGNAGWMAAGYFIPAYDGTKPCSNAGVGKGCPYGVWEVAYFGAPNQWVNQGNSHFDFGGAVLRRLNGKTISQRVGNLGFVANIPNVQHFHSFGWPARAPFTGHKLETCVASSAYVWDWGTAGQPVTGIGCNMTPGCSGGPWIVDYRGGSYVNGVNSHRRVDPGGAEYTDEMLSPYFGAAAWDLFQALYNATP
jgi:V8-like Glu-specific endopeptidase